MQRPMSRIGVPCLEVAIWYIAEAHVPYWGAQFRGGHLVQCRDPCPLLGCPVQVLATLPMPAFCLGAPWEAAGNGCIVSAPAIQRGNADSSQPSSDLAWI